MKVQDLKKAKRIRRKYHVRKKVFGRPDKLRLTVYRSSDHIYAQVIDDTVGKTLVSASTIDKDIKGMMKPDMNKRQESELVGKEIRFTKLTKHSIYPNGRK